MNATRIQAGSAVEMKFQVDVDGASVPVTEVRLSMKSGRAKVSYVAEYKKNVATFSISELEKYVSPGNIYEYELEVYVGSQYFVPFKGQIELVHPVSVKIESVTVEPVVRQIVAEQVGSVYGKTTGGMDKGGESKRNPFWVAPKMKKSIVGEIRGDIFSRIFNR